jgi:hypothetical protein
MTKHPLLAEIVEEINSRAVNYRVGALQSLRKKLRGLARLPTRNIFSSQTTFEEGQFAFHHGGRKELQFNVGFELLDGEAFLRHGVAFSLEPSQTLPTIDELVPKLSRFNEFLYLYPHEFVDFRMWHYLRDERRSSHLPSPIPPELIAPHVFIFLGKLQPAVSLNYDLILADFDRLLPLYNFVEGHSPFPAITDSSAGFTFRPGFTVRPSATVASIPSQVLDIQLRHNEIQRRLYEQLVERHGQENVGIEQPSNGVRVDVVLRHGHEYLYYEIKNASSARACIREALAQLLEYAYWPGAQEAARLIIVGEPELDPEARMYIERLRSRFGLPIDYQQIELGRGSVEAVPNHGLQRMPDGPTESRRRYPPLAGE